MPPASLEQYLGTFGQLISAAAARSSLLALLGAIVVLAILTGLTLQAAKLFKVEKMEVPPVVVSLLARATAAYLVILGIGPLLVSMVGDANATVVGIIATILFFLLPPFLYGMALDVVTPARRRGPNAALAMAFFADGVWTAGLALIVLLAKALNIANMALLFAVPGLGSVLNNVLWISLLLGGALAAGGFAMGNSLPNLGETGGTKPVIPPAPEKWLMLSGKQIPLQEGQHKIGRVEECTVRIIGDEEISREHALLRIQREAVTLGDLNSRNGTFLNGARVSGERTLQDGDVIRVGNTDMQFHQR